MDPNEALRCVRAALASMERANDAGTGIDEDAAIELMKHTRALDEWLTRGEFLPTAWGR